MINLKYFLLKFTCFKERLNFKRNTKKNLVFKFLKKLTLKPTYYLYLQSRNAKVAQLVELQPSKLVVASSSLVFRSVNPQMQSLGIFYFKPLKSLPDSNSSGFLFCLNNRAE